MKVLFHDYSYVLHTVIHKSVRKNLVSVEWRAKARTLLKKSVSYTKRGYQSFSHSSSYDSWLTLLEAAKVRDHSPILEIAQQLKENEVRKIFYHRERRILFKM